jgi:hypothetical protein
MATYVNDLRLKEITTGDESGTWGTSTNTNLELIAEAFSYGTEVITTNADTHTTTIADGATDPGRSLYLKYTGTLDSACTITIGPNTVSKVWIIENGTSGSQDIILSQGSGANITIPAGDTKVVYSDGAGAGAAFVDAFASLSVVDLTATGIVTAAGTSVFTNLDISGDIDVDGTTNLDVVDIDGAVDMASTLAVAGVVTANAGVVVDNFTLDGTTLALSSGNMALDSAGHILLDADSGEIAFQDSGTTFLEIANSSSNAIIRPTVQDKDILFNGNDGGAAITALTLDMSEAGAATFTSTVNSGASNAVGIGGTPADVNASEVGPGYLNLSRDDLAHATQIQFGKNGTVVGKIHTDDRLSIGTSSTGIYFYNSGNSILPYNNSAATPTTRDAAIDLGSSGARFKDLYLSGGAYLGGTVAANLLDDYEEGTWTPAITGTTGTPSVTYLTVGGTYTKIGNTVTLFFGIRINSISGGSGTVRITGLPFTAGSYGAYQNPGGIASTQVLTASQAGPALFYVEDSSSFLQGRHLNTNTDSPLSLSLFQNGSFIVCTFTYQL